jgi:hypothetical protein
MSDQYNEPQGSPIDPNPQPQYQQPEPPPQYQQAGQYVPAGDGAATASLVCGIIGLVLGNFILGIIAIIQGNKALRLGFPDGKAKAGKILGIIDIILNIVAVVFIIIFVVIGSAAYSLS